MIELLKTLRVVDSDGTLSLTSIVLMVATVRFAMIPLQTETLIALLGALASYQGKKVIGKMGRSEETSEDIASLSTQVQSLTNKMAIIEARTAPKR